MDARFPQSIAGSACLVRRFGVRVGCSICHIRGVEYIYLTHLYCISVAHKHTAARSIFTSTTAVPFMPFVSWGSTGLMAERNKRQASATSRTPPRCCPVVRRSAASGCTGSKVRACYTANQRVVTITICQAYCRAPLVLWLVLLAAAPSSAAVWVSTDGRDTTPCGSSLREACLTMESAIEQ